MRKGSATAGREDPHRGPNGNSPGVATASRRVAFGPEDVAWSRRCVAARAADRDSRPGSSTAQSVRFGSLAQRVESSRGGRGLPLGGGRLLPVNPPSDVPGDGATPWAPPAGHAPAAPGSDCGWRGAIAPGRRPGRILGRKSPARPPLGPTRHVRSHPTSREPVERPGERSASISPGSSLVRFVSETALQT